VGTHAGNMKVMGQQPVRSGAPSPSGHPTVSVPHATVEVHTTR
jgi:hypothetical protein